MRVEIADLQPLPGEVLGHREGLRIGQHPRDLRVQHLRDAEPSAFGQRQELFVRHRVPQEITEPRGQLDVRDSVHPARVGRIQIALDMKQEMRRDQHRLNCEGDSLFEGLSLTPRQCDESLQSGDFRAEHRPAIRATRQCREDPVHAPGIR